MNYAAGAKAIGTGMALIADNAFRRERQEWEMEREENLVRLRGEQAKEFENVRSANDEKAAANQRQFVEGENDRNREADDARQDRADRRAGARENRAYAKDDARELAELRRHRQSTLQNFRGQYSKALNDLNDAKASGMADEADLAELRSNVDYIAQEMQDFDAQTKDALAAAGDPWAKSQMLTDDDLAALGGDAGKPDGKPKGGPAIAVETGDGAATRKPKPMTAAPRAEKKPNRSMGYTETEPGKSPIPLVNIADKLKDPFGVHDYYSAENIRKRRAGSSGSDFLQTDKDPSLARLIQ